MCFCGRIPTMDYCGILACAKAREDAFQHEIDTQPATAAQPKPQGRGADITPLVIADLQARSAAGTAKYGGPLRAFNGRVALVDAYQEVLDLAQYMRQELEERREVNRLANYLLVHHHEAVRSGEGPVDMVIRLLEERHGR